MKRFNPDAIESVEFEYFLPANCDYRKERKGGWWHSRRPEGWYLTGRMVGKYTGNLDAYVHGLWIGKYEIRTDLEVHKDIVMYDGCPCYRPYVKVRTLSGDTFRKEFLSNHDLRRYMERFDDLINLDAV